MSLIIALKLAETLRELVLVNLTFQQVDWSPEVEQAARAIIRLAIDEDIGEECDWTTRSLVTEQVQATVAVVARKPGVVAGLPIASLVLDEAGSSTIVELHTEDGTAIAAGEKLGTLRGPAVELLAAERILLNFIGRLSGIASLTRQYVEAIAGTMARIYDTRKTTPGWRLLEKYAVRCGGGCNHRLGLNRAVMIKDNHVALAAQENLTLTQAVQRVRDSLSHQNITLETIEVEVDNLKQLKQVLPAGPDIILLDNMSTDQLSQAKRMRDELAPQILLEASGGVTLQTIARIAETGVDRISVGALTHSAISLDIGLDWLSSQ